MKKIILTLFTITYLFNSYSQNKVVYSVTSNTSGFNVTYTNSGGNTEQKDVSSKLWNYSFNSVVGSFVYISAQAQNKNSNISAKIEYKGAIIEESNSIGDYVIASASGTLSDFPNIYPYTKTFIGTQIVPLFSPILEKPDMFNSKQIGKALNSSVRIIEKYNNGYYKVNSEGVEGYLWVGWFEN